MRQRTCAFALAAIAVAWFVPAAAASQLIDRNATHVSLRVNADGRALVTYHKGGRVKHVLAWGALNANPPSPSHPQVAFHLNYRGGSLAGGCQPYDGPPLAWLVAACKAPDGSYWALQSWQRGLRDYGGASAPWELRLSHWTGSPATLYVQLDWSYHRFVHLWGNFSFNGQGVYGFRSTSRGVPLDSYGRNLYVDTFNSGFGRGWRRSNSFLTHAPNGAFCYGFYPHAGHSSAGTKLRATIIGPGVTPDVMWQGASPGPYNAALDAQQNEQQRSLFGASKACKIN